MRGWQHGGSLDAFARAKQRVKDLLHRYERPPIALEYEAELLKQVQSAARAVGAASLPLD